MLRTYWDPAVTLVFGWSGLYCQQMELDNAPRAQGRAVVGLPGGDLAGYCVSTVRCCVTWVPRCPTPRLTAWWKGFNRPWDGLRQLGVYGKR